MIACANLVGPVTSRYRWQGAIEESTETLMVLKTRADCSGRLRSRIAELHSYDVPEILEFAVSGGLEDYLSWVAESCSATPRE